MRPRLLTIFAHPDDESFGISGTIATYVQRGVLVYHICATRGEAGSSRPPSLSSREFGSIRERELRRAGRILGFQKIYILGYPDSGLKDLPFEEPVNRILSIIEEVRPHVIITFGQRGITGHPDHETVHRWATEAFFTSGRVAKIYYTTLSPEVLKKRGLPPVQGRITTIIDITPYLSFKRRAIHCHRSQWPGVKRVFSFAGGANPISKKDYFICGGVPEDDQERLIEEDLFTGIEWIIHKKRKRIREEGVELR